MNTPSLASASLYVGDLVPDITEAVLFEIFNQVGPVASIRVCRDTVTRRSLGYAYVNFHNVVDAERALDTMNYTPIKGKPCRIMWSHRDPSIRKSGVGNIFIKNLDKTIDNKALYDTFSAFGNILSCKVSIDLEGNSRGYGFVHFETSEAAQTAIQKVNGMLLNGKQVYVGPFVKRQERYKDSAETKFTNVFIKNLDESVGEDQLLELFNKYGPVTNCVVMRDAEGKSKGFGFVNFQNPEEAKQAVDELNTMEIAGKPVFAGRAQKKAEREQELRLKYEALKMERMNKYQGVNCYVKNLDDQVDDEKLRGEFQQYGLITSCKVMRDEKGISKGFGFVCFSNPDEAAKCVAEANGRMLGAKPMYVALAQRKEIRRAQLEQQYQTRMAAQGMRRMDNAALAGPPGPPPMYAAGAPVYFTQPGVPPQAGRPGFVYPPQMVPRPRMAAPPQYQQGARPGQYQPVPSYVNVAGGMPQPRRQGGQQRPRNVPGAPQQPGALPNDKAPPAGRGQPNVVAGGLGQPRTRNNIKYAPNVRNRADLQPQQVVQVPVGMIPPGAVVAGAPMPVAMPMPVASTDPLTASALAAATPEQQKQMLGERLFPLIQAQQPELAGKITGMLLEMDNGELLHLLESPDALNAKILEALQVLHSHAVVTSDGNGVVDANGVAVQVADVTADVSTA